MLVAYLHRLSKGDNNLNDGFSVVAPISSKGRLVFAKTVRGSKAYLNVALLDVRQKDILLRLVESVYLIKEEYSLSSREVSKHNIERATMYVPPSEHESVLRFFEDCTNVLYAGLRCAQLPKYRTSMPGYQPCKRGLPASARLCCQDVCPRSPVT